MDHFRLAAAEDPITWDWTVQRHPLAFGFDPQVKQDGRCPGSTFYVISFGRSTHMITIAHANELGP